MGDLSFQSFFQNNKGNASLKNVEVRLLWGGGRAGKVYL
jgi:hypothetical protein